MQRVVFILPDLSSGGAERVTLNVMQRLDRSKFNPVLFLIKNQGVYWDEVPTDVEVITALKAGERIRWHLLKLIRSLCQVIQRDNIVIGAMEYDSIFLAALAAKIRGCPAVGWFRVDAGYWADRFSLLRSCIIRWLFPALSAFVAVSQGVADSINKAYPWLPIRVQVLYNPLDVDYIRRRAELSAGIPVGRKGIPVIIGAGRLEYAKHFDLLIKAHAELLARGIQQELMILGEGSERPRLESLINDLAVNDTVSLPGFQANPFAIMQQATVFVLSSRYEGLPGVLLQALALGLPVIATDCPSGPAEILESGRYGLLVPSGDLPAMTDAIEKVLADHSLAGFLSALGKERADHFRPEVNIPAFEKLLLAISQQ